MDISADIAHLMKYGSTEEIRAYFDKKRKLQKQEDFFSFINDLIDNSPFKRAEVGPARSTLFSESVLNSLSERAKEGCISPGTPKPIVQTKTKIAREKDACLHPSPRYNAWYKAFL